MASDNTNAVIRIPTSAGTKDTWITDFHNVVITMRSKWVPGDHNNFDIYSYLLRTSTGNPPKGTMTDSVLSKCEKADVKAADWAIYSLLNAMFNTHHHGDDRVQEEKELSSHDHHKIPPLQKCH